MPFMDVKGLRIHRRALLKGVEALALVPLVVGLGGRMANAHPAGQNKRFDAVNHRTCLALLGTTGGMTWWPGSDRASASQVFVVGDAMYAIDLGFGATHRLAQAFNNYPEIPNIIDVKDIGDPAWPLYQHALSARTALDDVGRVAASFRAKTLVLSHIGPGNTPVARLRQARKGFDGRLLIGEDLLQIGVGKASRRTRVS